MRVGDKPCPPILFLLPTAGYILQLASYHVPLLGSESFADIVMCQICDDSCSQRIRLGERRTMLTIGGNIFQRKASCSKSRAFCIILSVLFAFDVGLTTGCTRSGSGKLRSKDASCIRTGFIYNGTLDRRHDGFIDQ